MSARRQILRAVSWPPLFWLGRQLCWAESLLRVVEYTLTYILARSPLHIFKPQSPAGGSGDLLRTEVERGGPLAKQLQAAMKAGSLVDDATILGLLQRAAAAAAADVVLVDGFPRSLSQVLPQTCCPSYLLLFWSKTQTSQTCELHESGIVSRFFQTRRQLYCIQMYAFYIYEISRTPFESL